MIKLPIRVGDDLRQRVQKSYAEAIRQVGKDEELYVRGKLPKILAGLTGEAGDWRMDVALTASAVYEAYENPDGKGTTNGSLRPVLLAALFYLCNPYDIIPDRVPSTGFVDDAIVLNDCLQRIEQQDPELSRNVLACISSLRR
ncbi:MAG: DUF1232 domain-containing protein [Pirellulales bacterium]|nr:DUF1232 domain-containing protein [Pirellulales bacterium]